MDTIGVLGAGAMGSGIAQVAAAAGHKVILCDHLPTALTKASKGIQASMKALTERGKITDSEAYSLFSRIQFADHMSAFRDCSMIIEAIVEDIDAKQIAFKSMEAVVPESTILASKIGRAHV